LDIGLEYVIETKGVLYRSKKGNTHIPIVKPRKVVETTGAGDAYRAGMISGLLDEKGIKAACQIGAKLGSKCVEEYGGQGYKL